MPVYEYQVTEGEGCEKCRQPFQWLQALSDQPLAVCPDCGTAVSRVVSRASFRIGLDASPDKAAQKGFTTFKKAGRGTWEKVAGPGVDVIQGSEAEIQAAKAPASSSKVIDLDAP